MTRNPHPINKTIFRFTLLVILLLTISSRIIRFSTYYDNFAESVAPSQILDGNKFLNQELFVKGETNKLNWQIEDPIMGAVIPHHGLAAKYISSFFTSIKDRNIQTMILIGPNHKAIGEKVVYTSQAAWKTNFGLLNPNLKVIDSLLENNHFAIKDEIIQDEHSVVTIMPYIANYFPQAEIVPLVINETDMATIEDIARILNEQMSGDTLVIAAVDFSHYLLANEAQQKDIETLEAITQKDYSALLRLGSDHLDSPTSIVLLDILMQKQGLNHFSLLENINSSMLTGNPVGVTSYVIGVYH